MPILRIFAVGAFCLAVTAASATHADESNELASRIAALEQRLTALEDALQPLIEKAKAEKRRESQQLAARRRMRLDSENYSPQELREIETLYQVANKKWRSDEAAESLRTLVEKYDKANRTGCAILYLGQMTAGEEQIKFLKQAVENHSDCFYGDGVQVGAFARLLLGQALAQNGQQDNAAKLFEEIRTKYPNAIDHRGNSLIATISTR